MKFKLTPQQKLEAHEAVEARIKRIAKTLETTRILIWTEKGGDGKTSLASALALEFDFSVITNEHRSPLPQILPADDVTVIGKDDDFPVVPVGNRVIIDCKGAADEAVGPAAQNSDVIIIPVKDHSDAQLYMFLESMSAMMNHNQKIVMVANACERGKFGKTSQRIKKFYPDLPLVEIRDSKAFSWVMNEGKSISTLVKEIPIGCSGFAGVRDQILGLAEIVAFEATQPASEAA